MNIRMLQTVETRLAWPNSQPMPLKALNDRASNSMRLTTHIHQPEVGDELTVENWHLLIGAEFDMIDSKATELIGLGYAEAM